MEVRGMDEGLDRSRLASGGGQEAERPALERHPGKTLANQRKNGSGTRFSPSNQLSLRIY